MKDKKSCVFVALEKALIVSFMIVTKKTQQDLWDIMPSHWLLGFIVYDKFY